MCWTVGISPRGEGLTGRGNLFPLPCLSCSKFLISPAAPHPARAFAGGYPCTLCRQPPPHPRLRRSSPAPSRGRGPCVVISGEQPCPGWSRRAAVPGSSPVYSRILDRVDIATGGGADGEGELVSLPCLSRSNHFASRCRHFCEGYPVFCRQRQVRPRFFTGIHAPPAHTKEHAGAAGSPTPRLPANTSPAPPAARGAAGGTSRHRSRRRSPASCPGPSISSPTRG